MTAAIRAMPRTGFLRPADRHRAGFDGPIQIGAGQTSSQPRTVAQMLRLLDVEAGQHVLDVGAGSGWTTALLAHLTGPTGSVRGVELDADLASWGAGNLAVTGQPWASIVRARDGALGLPEHAPYDRILVSAEPPDLPRQLVDQLAVGGRMVIPVAGTMLVVVRHDDGSTVTEHGHFRFVPLR